MSSDVALGRSPALCGRHSETGGAAAADAADRRCGEPVPVSTIAASSRSTTVRIPSPRVTASTGNTLRRTVWTAAAETLALSGGRVDAEKDERVEDVGIARRDRHRGQQRHRGGHRRALRPGADAGHARRSAGGPAGAGGRTGAAGGEALVVPTDVRDPAAVDRMAAVTKEAWGRIDVLVANAGVGGKSLLKMSDEALAELVETNLLGVMRCARAVVPVMLERRDGHIITNASVAGRVIAPGSVYAATKAGVLAFTEALRRAYADSGIRVSAVLPGWIDTPIVQGVPPRRMAPPGVVADAVVRLLHRPRPEIVVPGWYRIPIWLDHWVPLLTDLLAPRVVRRVERQAERRAARQAERP